MELIRINEFKKKAKKRYYLHLILVLLFLAVVAIGLVLSIQLSPWQIYEVFMIINIVVSVLVTLAAIFYFANIFPIISHYYKFYQNMTTVSLDHRRSRTYLSELESKNINHVNYRVLLFSYKEGEKEYKENLYSSSAPAPKAGASPGRRGSRNSGVFPLRRSPSPADFRPVMK